MFVGRNLSRGRAPRVHWHGPRAKGSIASRFTIDPSTDPSIDPSSTIILLFKRGINCTEGSIEGSIEVSIVSRLMIDPSNRPIAKGLSEGSIDPIDPFRRVYTKGL